VPQQDITFLNDVLVRAFVSVGFPVSKELLASVEQMVKAQMV